MPFSLPTGPISLQGAPSAPKQAADLPVVKLRVVSRPPEAGYGHPASVNVSGEGPWAVLASYLNPTCFIQLASGSDCVLSVRQDSSVAAGCLVLDDVQQYNLRILAGDWHEFQVFQPPTDQPFELVDIDIEVRLLKSWNAASEDQSGLYQVNAAALTSAFSKQYFGRVLAVNELIVIQLVHVPLLLRITSTNTLAEDEQEEAIGYHCYRGVLTPTTAIYLHALSEVASHDQHWGSSKKDDPVDMPSTSSGIAAGIAELSLDSKAAPASSFTTPSPCRSVVLVGARTRATRPPPTNIVHVTTTDGDVFPVKKPLLRPCIALTKVVRDSGSQPAATEVDVGTLTFDRVLIYLEAQHLKKPPPTFALHLIGELEQAAVDLGLGPLAQMCAERRGAAAAVRVWRWSEVVAANAAGRCCLCMTGMLLDVTRWLPEHPGGASIIPAQALDRDSTRFFEIYHASRESFLYLKDFYVGELHPDDLQLVPPSPEPPSSEFMSQLTEYTTFRMDVAAALAAGGPANSCQGLAEEPLHRHLGQKPTATRASAL